MMLQQHPMKYNQKIMENAVYNEDGGVTINGTNKSD